MPPKSKENRKAKKARKSKKARIGGSGKEEKRPIKVMVLVGNSVGCLMGCFRAPLPWQKTATLKRPIKRSMNLSRRHLNVLIYLLNLGGSEWGWCRWGRRSFPIPFCFFVVFLRFFIYFFFVFLRFFASSLLFSHSPREQGQRQFTASMGNFTPTPSAPTPCTTSRSIYFRWSPLVGAPAERIAL